MKWIELRALINATDAGTVASTLEKFGHGGVAIERPPGPSAGRTTSVKAYLLYGRSYAAQKRQIEEGLANLKLKPPVKLEERVLKPDDWLDSMKQHFHPQAIGNKFIVRPIWADKTPVRRGRIAIELDPGAAFGTGLHPTTRLCLLAVEKYVQPGMSILDLGTGSGILAIATAKLGASPILALDTDPAAVKSAKSNASSNVVAGCIAIRRGTLSRRAQRIYRDSFDMVLANITYRAISDLSSGLAEVLKPGGKLIVSGIHDQGLDEVLIKLALADLRLEAVNHEEKWHAVIASKIKSRE